MSAAASNMLLAVTALGYATTWVEGTLARKEEEMKELLDIPMPMRLIILLPIGKPAESGGQSKKKPLSGLVHWEKW